MRAVPQPYDQVSFQRDEQEIARLHFGPGLNRPFVYPVMSPSGRPLTRMGHPGDPHSHSHHNSIWISYSSVNGVDFWSDHRADGGRIVVERVLEIVDSPERAGVITKGAWVTATGQALLTEKRSTWAYPLDKREWLLVIELMLETATEKVVFAAAGFGPIGVRMEKWLSEQFGDGAIRNSEGQKGEPSIFRKPALWVDYSGSSSPGITEGLTLLDHPGNPDHPSPFHVRKDGWMGAILSNSKAITVTREKPLHLRYGVYVHSGVPSFAELNQRWKDFTKL